ncbi:ATP-dependent RNA helicase SUV3 homolog, mitochondrial isoform X1 [Cotesia glomerata]|uniref:ATP-dependent RNA helicase SUV3 homolog, mitochondrial n=2 Tax=Cotesia glomerata TaxID=32391 RepID=A0AAV7IG29_COTGL|nr:ATP-dependent RNA helicase SUV3 homolog, mitochondrial isoform X1 [Cotesia glomerata]KAH0550032.1 hypothetical protein KQX54_016965 [Cotesia glomerata]
MLSIKSLLGNIISPNSLKPKLLSRSLTPLINEFHRTKKSSVEDSTRRSNKRRSNLRDKKIPYNVIESLFKPVEVLPDPYDEHLGAEITGKLNKSDVYKVVSAFIQRKEVRDLAKDEGLSIDLLKEAVIGFKRYCDNPDTLPVDLHVIISDLIKGSGHVLDIYPYFMRFAKEMYPHLNCMPDLIQISDLRNPAKWYPQARLYKRKIIFHAGPTNSGKTYHALERFRNAKNGIYCGPLKLLAVEVFKKTNELGTPCDLVTGEERLFAINEDNPAEHVACTVEMARIDVHREVAIIDEIQLLKDNDRGWAWTRALLGIPADEIHLCGEAGAIDLVKKICATMDEEVEVHPYQRLTPLTIENHAVSSLNNIQPGDCIVCFSKNDIYAVSRELELLGKKVAVIYGSLPPNTKLKQAAKFNDPNDPCKIMVATDAIGMGLNLNIRRIVFYSLRKPTVNNNGEKEIDILTVSSALQIAGRAGRHGTQWQSGFVTTFKPEDHSLLKTLLSQLPEPILKAGLHPTADQIEHCAYYLPKSTLSNIIDIFVSLSRVDDSLYFICNIDYFKYLADKIQDINLPLRARYVFCCAPINIKSQLVCVMFRKFATQYFKNELITCSWLCKQIDNWPLETPKTIVELVHLEAVFDVFDLYLWLSYRFPDLFPDQEAIRQIQKEIDLLIQDGIIRLTKLFSRTEPAIKISGEFQRENEDKNADLNQIQRYKDRPKPTYGKGKLTNRLISQGLLTANMIKELRLEWAEELEQENKPISDNDKPRTKKSSEVPKKTKCMCES